MNANTGFEFSYLNSTGAPGLDGLEYVFQNVDGENINVGYDWKGSAFCIKSFSGSLRGKITDELRAELFAKALEIEES